MLFEFYSRIKHADLYKQLDVLTEIIPVFSYQVTFNFDRDYVLTAHYGKYIEDLFHFNESGDLHGLIENLYSVISHNVSIEVREAVIFTEKNTRTLVSEEIIAYFCNRVNVFRTDSYGECFGLYTTDKDISEREIEGDEVIYCAISPDNTKFYTHPVFIEAVKTVQLDTTGDYAIEHPYMEVIKIPAKMSVRYTADKQLKLNGIILR